MPDTSSIKSQVRPPTVIRYRRVENILANEDAFVELNVHKTFSIPQQRNTEKGPSVFSDFVVAVTMRLHEQGHDAYNAHKPTILITGIQVRKEIEAGDYKFPSIVEPYRIESNGSSEASAPAVNPINRTRRSAAIKTPVTGRSAAIKTPVIKRPPAPGPRKKLPSPKGRTVIKTSTSKRPPVTAAAKPAANPPAKPAANPVSTTSNNISSLLCVTDQLNQRLEMPYPEVDSLISLMGGHMHIDDPEFSAHIGIMGLLLSIEDMVDNCFKKPKKAAAMAAVDAAVKAVLPVVKLPEAAEIDLSVK